jgi:LysR family nitrogen assimilation transcriptional regulator
MNLRQLRYFVTIVDAGSFSRAARIAHVAQPALSQQIADLEGLLGVTLLQRSVRGVSATPAGERLYMEARAILRRVERLPEVVLAHDDEVEGSVCVGMSSTLASSLSGPIMAACLISLPKVRLKVSSAGSLQLAARIREQTLDLALLFEDAPLAGFVRVPLFERRLFLVRRANESVARESIGVDELATLPLVLPHSPNVTRAALDRVFAQAGIEPRVAAEVDLITELLAAVQAGVGNAILPLGSTNELPGHAMFTSQVIEPPISLTACIVSSTDAPLGPVGEAVRDFIADFARKGLGESQAPQLS